MRRIEIRLNSGAIAWRPQTNANRAAEPKRVDAQIIKRKRGFAQDPRAPVGAVFTGAVAGVPQTSASLRVEPGQDTAFEGGNGGAAGLRSRRQK